MDIRIISIEGNIGSGKTTLWNSLMEHFKNDRRIVFVREPVDEWEKVVDEEGNSMITKFYGDQSKYAFSFQIMACATRFAVLRDAILENRQATIFITERSMHTDKYVFAKMLYDTGKMELVNYTIYCHLFESFVRHHSISSVIYVNTSPEVCLERVAIRNRVGEANVPLEYLQYCHAYHEEMIEDIASGPINILRLDGNINIHESVDAVIARLNSIQEFLGV